MFRNRRQLQRWARRLLVFWLVGIAAGVANACVVADRATADAQQRSTAMVAAAAMSGSAADSGHQDAPGDASHAGKASCQEVCVKSSVAIPPVKSDADTAGGQGPAPAHVVVALPPDALVVQHWAPGRERGHAPPIAIAFLRLAL